MRIRMRTMATLAALLASLLVAGCGGGGGEGGGGDGGGNGGGQQPGTRTLTGQVTNQSGQPIAGATVSAAGQTATTTANGTYSLTGLPNTGNITVTVTASGFQQSSTVITDTSQAALNVQLQSDSGLPFDPDSPPPPPVFPG